VRDKAAAAHRAGLTAIICIGETLEEREAGRTLDDRRGPARRLAAGFGRAREHGCGL
jgi:triosephosphate isomerase